MHMYMHMSHVHLTYDVLQVCVTYKVSAGMCSCTVMCACMYRETGFIHHHHPEGVVSRSFCLNSSAIPNVWIPAGYICTGSPRRAAPPAPPAAWCRCPWGYGQSPKDDGSQRAWLKHNLNFNGWSSHVRRGFLPEGLSQAILVGIILVGRRFGEGRNGQNDQPYTYLYIYIYLYLGRSKSETGETTTARAR